MTAIHSMTDEEFDRHTFAILRLNRAGGGDYSRDRHLWLEGKTIQEIMAKVAKVEGGSGPTS